jgi:hypothetical protein
MNICRTEIQRSRTHQTLTRRNRSLYSSHPLAAVVAITDSHLFGLRSGVRFQISDAGEVSGDCLRTQGQCRKDLVILFISLFLTSKHTRIEPDAITLRVTASKTENKLSVWFVGWLGNSVKHVGDCASLALSLIGSGAASQVPLADDAGQTIVVI